MHPCELPDQQLLDECDERRQRRSGPGGQHRNKVETAVVLTHRATGIRAEASERRSQQENRRVALGRLRVNLALQVRSPQPPATLPSSRWAARSRHGVLRVSPHHEDFAPLLAEALDVLAREPGDARAAAQRLGVSSSQLIRFLKLEPRALEQVNQAREQQGRHRLQ